MTTSSSSSHDSFDLFSTKPLSPKPITNPATTTTQTLFPTTTTTTTSDYFQCLPGTLLGNDYMVKGKLGDGAFSTVVLVQQQDSGVEYAAKVLRGNETMQRAGEKELELLKSLHQPNPHPNLVALVDSFQLLDVHLVLVFERMEMNLRVCLDTFGKNVGISIYAVKSYMHQLLSALERLQNMNVVHADLKPDNILVSSDLARIKIADFGCAMRLDCEDVSQPVPYLVSRYYRAPEIILCTSPITCAIDVWAAGVTAFELCTGMVLFPGQTNNDQLRLIMTCLGRFSNAIVKKHIAVFQDKLEKEPHFEHDYRFKSHEVDKVNHDIVVRRLVTIQHPPAVQHSLRARLFDHHDSHHDEAMLDLVGVLEGCLKLDPMARLDATKAISMAFFTRKKQHGSMAVDDSLSAVKRQKQ